MTHKLEKFDLTFWSLYVCILKVDQWFVSKNCKTLCESLLMVYNSSKDLVLYKSVSSN